MLDLATFVIIANEGDAPIPAEVIMALKRNGWRPVRENALYALPWDTAPNETGGASRDLLHSVEEVRSVLARLRIRHRFETLDNALKGRRSASG